MVKIQLSKNCGKWLCSSNPTIQLVFYNSSLQCSSQAKLPWYATAFVTRQSLKSSESSPVISDRSAAIMYFPGNPKILPHRPSSGLRVSCLIRSFWMPSLAQSRTLFLHFPAMPAALASGNKRIPKGQRRCVGACAPTALQDMPALAKAPSALAYAASSDPVTNRLWKISTP